MIHFESLTLNGFKSFVDKTSLKIENGLTGVVGPNGCGKSNLVEALRWVMGATSAKSMRAGSNGMEDVIFNGTSNRPMRNFAEVVVVLNNSKRTAPAQYNESDEIEIVRRIERDQGSVYRINGKIARARDVQTLFADMMAGAHSPALVSQGKVTAIINAKPVERRAILEESAGVSGLYARRHEAELRLKAADTNLARVQDAMNNMETQLNALKRQSRQALRYRNITDEIKSLEKIIAGLEWIAVNRESMKAQNDFKNAEQMTTDATLATTQLAQTQNAQAEALPALRNNEAEAAARLQTQKIALERLNAEEAQIQKLIEETSILIKQIAADTRHEQQTVQDNSQSLSKMEEEERALQNQAEGVTEKREILESECITNETAVLELESRYQKAVGDLATCKAQQEEASRQTESASARVTTLENKRDELMRKKAEQKQNLPDFQDIAHLRAEIDGFEKTLQDQTAQLNQERQTLQETEINLDKIRTNMVGERETLSKNIIEIKTIKDFLANDSAQMFKPVLDLVQAQEGFEQALSKALGEALLASLDDQAPATWRAIDNIAAPALPVGVKPLIDYVDVPAALKCAIGYVGWVDTHAEGQEAARQLKPGQVIVSKDGHVWRWDGYTLKPTAQDRQTAVLSQKNKLAELEQKTSTLETSVQNAETAYQNQVQLRDTKRRDVQTLETQVQELQGRINQKRRDVQAREQEQTRLSTDLIKIEETLVATLESLQAAQTDFEKAQHVLNSLDTHSIQLLEQDIQLIKTDLTTAQEKSRNSVLTLARFDQEESRRKARLQAISDERISVQNRTIRAREQLKTLEERQIAATEKYETLKQKPKDIEKERGVLMSSLTELQKLRDVAADALTIAEKELADTTRALKEAEEILMNAREARAHAQAMQGAAIEKITTLQNHIEEQLNTKPEDILTETGLSFDADELPDAQENKNKRDKLIRDRESIGPVNLRADVEAQEIEQQLTTITNEKNDLTQAIDELRTAINKLNMEARERLLQAFDVVNTHFGRLFTQLFNGGQANLKFIESDDPLESGLEILAQPPGKTLQSLSLLSGGEQTLASIALIFAMFLTNPAPICVLDEIDAPLDDANVDRVCSLLETIYKETQTRFMVITHHRMTMARMNRLFGVTMAERGVSQLVSVNLQEQLDFLEAA